MLKIRKIKEKHHRLALSEHCGLIQASFTICVRKHLPIFVDVLHVACKKYFCVNWAYVFMPDHVHITIEGVKECSNLWKTIVLFKQKTGYWFLRNMPKIQWQKDFYDHIHRNKRELINHILYIANNPVKKNLVKHWKDYPFNGSLDNDLNAIIWE